MGGGSDSRECWVGGLGGQGCAVLGKLARLHQETETKRGQESKDRGGPGFRRLSMVPKVSSHFQPEPGPLPPQPVLSPPHSFVPASPQVRRFFDPWFIPGHQFPRDSEPPHPQPRLLPSRRLLPGLGLKNPPQPGVPRWYRLVSRSTPEPAPAPGLALLSAGGSGGSEQVGQTGGGGT